MESLSQILRSASMSDHRTAENVHFITHLMKGELTKRHYVEYLNQLAFVYQALERSLPETDTLPYHSGLRRFDRIVADLEALGVDDWQQTVILPATAAYVSRLEQLSVSDHAFLAHHYTRYLGDLSGGQAIGALMQRHYGLGTNQVSFYDFSNLGDPVPIKVGYREAMDSTSLTDAQISELVAEVQLAFKLNTALFIGLGELELV